MWVQIIYTVVTLMAFAVILLTVHIRIGALEAEVRRLNGIVHNHYARALWGPQDFAKEDHDHE